MEAVRTFVREAHLGQVDKLGRDYYHAHILPIAAGASLFGEQAEKAALLHDILEDTEVTANDLLARGIEPEIVSAVQSVSRLATESYEELIGRAMVHPIGKIVKLVDNAWNILSNPDLAKRDPQKAKQILEGRYLPARDRLLIAMGINACWLGYQELQQVLELEHEALSTNAS